MTAPGPIGIVGGGAWGSALAVAAATAGNRVLLSVRDPAAAERIERCRNNPRLPGIRLPEAVRVVSGAAALAEAACLLLAVPAQSVRDAVAALAGHVAPDRPVVICAKGIERLSDRFLSEVVAAIRPAAPVAALSGPGFAGDVARGLPTAVALAARDGELARSLAATLSGPTFRVYHGTDLRGVEIGGAAKNVLAIAAGAVEGRGLGESAKAALVARGFAELLRFAAAHGGRTETLMGLSGLGDLVLTASSASSRNFALGRRIGAGGAVEAGPGDRLAEGAHTAAALLRLARRAGVDMPVSAAVDDVLSGRIGVDEAVEALMRRPLREE